jgi:hypothetical protein
MDIILTRARLTATTGLVIFPAEFLSAPARGFMAFTDARASMAALGFMVVAISMIADIATSDAGAMVMASAAATTEAAAIEENFEAGTTAAATKEEAFMAAEASMVQAASTVAAADKLHFQAVSKSPTHQATPPKRYGTQREGGGQPA